MQAVERGKKKIRKRRTMCSGLRKLRIEREMKEGDNT